MKMEMTWEDDNTRHVKADAITVLFPGSLILWPPGASEERSRRLLQGGKMRDHGNEVDAIITALTQAMLESNERWTYHD